MTGPAGSVDSNGVININIYPKEAPKVDPTVSGVPSGVQGAIDAGHEHHGSQVQHNYNSQYFIHANGMPVHPIILHYPLYAAIGPQFTAEQLQALNAKQGWTGGYPPDWVFPEQQKEAQTEIKQSPVDIQHGEHVPTAYEDIMDAILHPETENKQHSYEIVKEIFADTGLDPNTVGSLLCHVLDYGLGSLSAHPVIILLKKVAEEGANGAYKELSQVDWDNFGVQLEAAYIEAYEHQSIPTSNYDAYY